MAQAFADTEKLVVKQKFEPLEAFANAAANALDLDALGGLGETANKYDVYTNDSSGKKFQVLETSNFCCRCCFRPNHAMQLHVFEPQESPSQESLTFDRPCKCGHCCSCCSICRQEMAVLEQGRTIGYIKEPFLGGGFSPTLQVMDREDGEPVAKIQANAVCCIGGICCDHTFEVTDAKTGAKLGEIVKQRPKRLGQLATELVSDADIFQLDMERNLPASRKASLFGALHLIDYYLFESEGDGKLDIVNGECSVKCCDLYCCGCVVPCGCGCGGSDADGDD